MNFPQTASTALIRPGKVDSLFPISHFLDFKAGSGNYSLLIKNTTQNNERNKTVSESRANKRAWHIESEIMKVECLAFAQRLHTQTHMQSIDARPINFGAGWLVHLASSSRSSVWYFPV